MSSKCGSTPSFPETKFATKKTQQPTLTAQWLTGFFRSYFHSFHPTLGVFIQTNTGNTSTNRHRQLFWKYTRLAIQESRSRLGPEWDRSQHRKTGFSPKDLDGSSTCIENPNIGFFPSRSSKNISESQEDFGSDATTKSDSGDVALLFLFWPEVDGNIQGWKSHTFWALFHWEKTHGFPSEMPNSPWILMDSQFLCGRRYDLFVHLPSSTECGENCLIWKVYIHKECARKQWP